MNYRHIYHAGNFADIFKHLLLTMTLSLLQQKEKGMFALDAFGGCGLYDLTSSQSQKTDEFRGGIGAFMDIAFTNPDLNNFQNLLRPYWEKNRYPGSPRLIGDMLRPQDRMIANELHLEDHASLKDAMLLDMNARVTKIDAYESVRANIPPGERRGLVLVDPPFERKDEFDVLARQMAEWMRKWPTGCYMIWYPIKAASNQHLIFDAVAELNTPKTFVSEFLLNPRNTRDSFNGCGVVIINTPFQLAERIHSLTKELRAGLGAVEMTSEYLTPA